MKDKLQAYFDAARAQEPVMDKAGISALLNRPKVVVKNKRWFHLRIFITMIVLSACTLAVWLLTNNSPVQTNVKTEQHNYTPLKSEQPAVEQSAAVPEKRLPDAVHKPRLVVPGHLLGKQLADWWNEAGFFDQSNISESMPQQAPVSDGNYITENGYLVLSHEELIQLGIKTNGNILQYGNITGDLMTVPGCESCNQTYPFYIIMVEKHGSRKVSMAVTQDSAFIGKSLPFWPSQIWVKEDDKIEVSMVELFNEKGYEKDFSESVKEMLVPVLVVLKAKPGKWSHDLNLVFWFKKEDAFFNALPDEARAIARARFGRADMRAYKDSLEKYRSVYRQKGMKGFEPAAVEQLSNRVVKLSDQKLKQLGIIKSKNGFVYSAHLNAAGESKFLHIKKKGEYIEISKNRSIVRLGAFSRYTPVALSDEKISHISYLKFFSGNDPGDHLAEKQFRENIMNLVPVLVSPGSLFFFEKDSALIALMGSPSRFSAHDLMRLQKNYLKMTEDDFTRLNRFTPVAISDIDLTRIDYVSNNATSQVRDDATFLKVVNELIAVRVDGSETVVWYETSESLNETLSTLYYKQNPDISGIRQLHLEMEQLKNLGISQTHKGTSIPSIVSSKMVAYGIYYKTGSEHAITFNRKDTGSQIAGSIAPDEKILHVEAEEELVLPTFEDKKELVPQTLYPTPSLITNSSGLVWYMYALDEEEVVTEKDRMDEAFMKQRNVANRAKLTAQLSSFIPVSIPVDGEYIKANRHISLIAWYKPDSLFLNALPVNIARELKAELESITNNKPAATCKYFDACGNRAGALQSVTAYPNPFYRDLSFFIQLKEARDITISLTDVHGKLLRTLCDKKACQPGNTSLEYHLNDIADGMYLLVITTDQGERIVQRLIRKRE